MALKDASDALSRVQGLYGLVRRESGVVSPRGKLATRNARKAGEALKVVQQIGGLTPRIDANDPDLLGEEIRARMLRERIEERRQLEAEAKAAQAVPSVFDVDDED